MQVSSDGIFGTVRRMTERSGSLVVQCHATGELKKVVLFIYIYITINSSNGYSVRLHIFLHIITYSFEIVNKIICKGI